MRIPAPSRSFAMVALLIAAARPARSAESQGLFPVVEKGKWGYMDRSGNTVIPPQFDYYVDRKGKFVRKPIK